MQELCNKTHVCSVYKILYKKAEKMEALTLKIKGLFFFSSLPRMSFTGMESDFKCLSTDIFYFAFVILLFESARDRNCPAKTK